MSSLMISNRLNGERIYQIQTEQSIIILNESNIVFCSESEMGIMFHMISGDDIHVEVDFQSLILQRERHDLIMVHSSYLVNRKYIYCFYKGPEGHLEMTDKSKIPVEEEYKGIVINYLYSGG